MKIISHVPIIYTLKFIRISVYSSLYVFCIIMIKSYHFSVLCFCNICLLLLIFIMYPYSCYACSIVYMCKYCVCPHGLYGLLDVGIKVSIYIHRLLDSLECWLRVREVPGSIPSRGPRHKNGTSSSNTGSFSRIKMG